MTLATIRVTNSEDLLEYPVGTIPAKVARLSQRSSRIAGWRSEELMRLAPTN
jgi:hypothetical protein